MVDATKNATVQKKVFMKWAKHVYEPPNGYVSYDYQ